MAFIDTPWLREQNRDYTAEGVQTGAAIQRSFLDSVQRKMEIEQQKQEFPLRLKGLALQQEATQANMRANELAMERNRLLLGQSVRAEAEALKADADRADWYQRLSAMNMPETAAMTLEEKRAMFYGGLAEKPWLRDDPLTQRFAEDLKAAEGFRSLEERALMQAQSRVAVKAMDMNQEATQPETWVRPILDADGKPTGRYQVGVVGSKQFQVIDTSAMSMRDRATVQSLNKDIEGLDARIKEAEATATTIRSNTVARDLAAELIEQRDALVKQRNQVLGMAAEAPVMKLRRDPATGQLVPE